MGSLNSFFNTAAICFKVSSSGLLMALLLNSSLVVSQSRFPNLQAHAHNDYEHARPLKEALENGFISVEADVHLQNNTLLVYHNRPGPKARTLEQLYLAPLDSLLKANAGTVYIGYEGPFFLMIDCKSDATTTYHLILRELKKHPALLCSSGSCAVKIFISGNRDIATMLKDGYLGIGIDGRPSDIGRNFSSEIMPLISDNFKNWSSWNGKADLSTEDLKKVKDLAARVHVEGKQLRLWAIPDNEKAWEELLLAGVDLINTDHLKELNIFLTRIK